MEKSGALFYENMLAYERHGEWVLAEEYLVFTNSNLTGISSYGPYELLFTGNMFEENNLKSSHVLRVKYCFDKMLEPSNKTEADHYSGKWISEEFISILALILGIRIKIGGSIRRIEVADQIGHPYILNGLKIPYLPKGDLYRRNMIPDDRKDVSLDNTAIMQKLTKLTQTQSSALVRSALLYQEGLWISESQPEQSWIYFVSAVECIAVEWDPSKEKSVEKMRASQPEVAEILLSYGGNDLLEKIADLLSRYMGATNKFIRFLSTFQPPPPHLRPLNFYIDYSDSQMFKKHMSKIYSYRSSALHSGMPFPAPMCQPPFKMGDGYIEIPIGTYSSSYGSTWRVDELPMLLHSFAYIARGAILLWLENTIEQI